MTSIITTKTKIVEDINFLMIITLIRIITDKISGERNKEWDKKTKMNSTIGDHLNMDKAIEEIIHRRMTTHIDTLKINKITIDQNIGVTNIVINLCPKNNQNWIEIREKVYQIMNAIKKLIFKKLISIFNTPEAYIWISNLKMKRIFIEKIKVIRIKEDQGQNIREILKMMKVNWEIMIKNIDLDGVQSLKINSTKVNIKKVMNIDELIREILLLDLMIIAIKSAKYMMIN